MAIQLVGCTTGTQSSGLASYTVSLTALTGGIGTAPIAGDLILVQSGWASKTNDNPDVTTAGFTEVADLYSTNTHDLNMSVAYAIAGASPPTSVTVSGSGSTVNGSSMTVAVFRGVDSINPFDATIATAVGAGSGDANCPPITPVTAGNWVIAIGGVAAVNGNTFTPPTGFTELTDQPGSSALSRSSSFTMAYKSGNTPGAAVNPTAFTWAGTGASGSWAAATVALRPSLGRVKVWNGSAWQAKPVKVWNGTSWVLKPMKYWNGTAWVPTNY